MAGLKQFGKSMGYSETSVVTGEPPAGAETCVPLESAEHRHAQLTRTIEGEIIPRLMLAHQAGARRAAPPAAGLRPTADDVAEFARLVTTHDVAVAAAFVEAMRANGISLEALFLDLMAPTARLLGDLWKADACHFTDVTVGLCRLQQLLRELSPAFENEIEHREHGRRALLLPFPGERHTFGVSMVEEFFRRAGWDVWGGPLKSVEDILTIVRTEWFAVIGLSVSCESTLTALAAAIRAIRRESCNRNIGVIVGGRLFVDHPARLAEVGADATAADGREAVAQAEGLLGVLARRC